MKTSTQFIQLITFLCLTLVQFQAKATGKFTGQTATVPTPFVHTTAASNINGHMTTLDHASTNGNPNALLFISQQYGQYNAHQVGVWYSNGKWIIYQEDKAAMPVGTRFNVVAAEPSDFAFLHKADASNIQGNWTIIDHPKCNNNPNALLLVTQNWVGSYNPKPIGVWYTGTRWAIYNEDRSVMPQGARFNVMVIGNGNASNVSGASTGLFTATASSKTNAWGKYLALTGNTDANATLFITQNWRSNGPYNNHISALWFTGKEWSIYNQDKADLPDNAMFNVLSFGKAADPVVTTNPVTPTAPIPVNGRTVNLVRFGFNGQELGTYRQMNAKSWQEVGAGAAFNFQETNRDDWSVYLFDPSRQVNIQIDLHTKNIYYSDRNTPRRVQYTLMDASARVTGWLASEVTFTDAAGRTSGRYQSKGAGIWHEVALPSNQTNFRFVEVARDDWSVYLEDRSRMVAIQLDLHTRKVMYNSIGKNDRFALYTIVEALGGLQSIPSGMIQILGSDDRMTVAELRNDLQKGGFTLVARDNIGPNECALVYPNADEDDLSANFALLTCATKVNDQITISSVAAYGGCDLANPLTQGVGSKCEVGVLQDKLTVNHGSFNQELVVSGPHAGECTAVSSEMLCANAGATLASTSYTISDKNGNGIGFSAEIGVGAGINSSFEDGILSGSINAKLLGGGSITYSLNVQQVGQAVYDVGQTGFVTIGKGVVGAGEGVKKLFTNEIGPGVADVTNQFVGVAKQGGESIVKFSGAAASTVKSGAEQLATGAWNGTVSTATQAAKQVESLSKKFVSLFGF